MSAVEICYYHTARGLSLSGLYIGETGALFESEFGTSTRYVGVFSFSTSFGISSYLHLRFLFFPESNGQVSQPAYRRMIVLDWTSTASH